MCPPPPGPARGSYFKLIGEHCAQKSQDGKAVARPFAQCTMNQNPVPCNLGNVVLKKGEDGVLRRRGDDEATVAGTEQEHHFFIVAVNIGVSIDCFAY